MKKVLLLMSVIALTACNVNLGNGGKILEASKDIVTKKYKLAPFEEVTIRCVGDVMLIQSDSLNGVVELTAPDNYIELYHFKSTNEKLDISFAKNINIHTQNVKIKIYTTDLISIHNSGASNVRMDSLDTDQLEVTNTGIGAFCLNKILADNVIVRCNGVGDITIGGQSGNADLSCSGVGCIRAEELKAQNVTAMVSGVGSIDCYAIERINGRVSGVGSLRYGGHPKYKDTSHPGIGSINEI